MHKKHMTENVIARKPLSFRLRRGVKQVRGDYQLYILLIPALAYYIIFHYLPMYGIQMAFMDFNPIRGFANSKWVGFKNFTKYFNGPYFWPTLKNTLTLSLYSLLASTPLAIIFALILNNIPALRFKKTVQMVTYAPHFISVVVLVGMLKLFLSPNFGVVNNVLGKMGLERINFMQKSQYFPHLYVWSGIWQGLGWSSIIYIAALSGISPEMHEAAVVDGATKLQRIWHIDLPGIMPTIVTLLILSAGRVLSVGFEKVYLMQNNVNATVSEVISTYAYKVGLVQAKYSFSATVSLFNSVINLFFLLVVNYISRKLTDSSLF